MYAAVAFTIGFSVTLRDIESISAVFKATMKLSLSVYKFLITFWGILNNNKKPFQNAFKMFYIGIFNTSVNRKSFQMLHTHFKTIVLVCTYSNCNNRQILKLSSFQIRYRSAPVKYVNITFQIKLARAPLQLIKRLLLYLKTKSAIKLSSTPKINTRLR